MVPINHVGLTLAQRDTWKRMVGIKLAYAGFVGLRALDQHQNQRLAIKLARWAKWHRANVICRRRANKTADKMSALAQQMIAFWHQHHTLKESIFFLINSNSSSNANRLYTYIPLCRSTLCYEKRVIWIYLILLYWILIIYFQSHHVCFYTTFGRILYFYSNN